MLLGEIGARREDLLNLADAQARRLGLVPPARLALQQIALAQIVLHLVVHVHLYLLLMLLTCHLMMGVACTCLPCYAPVLRGGEDSRVRHVTPLEQVWGVLGAVVAEIRAEFLGEQRHVVGLRVPEDGVVVVGPVGVVRREHGSVGMPDRVQRGGEICR